MKEKNLIYQAGTCMMSEMVGTALDKNIFLSGISHHNILNILHYISWYKF